MKKVLVILLVVVISLGIVAVYVANRPEAALYQMYRDIKQDGIAAIEPHLTSSLKPMLRTVLKVANQPWLTGLLDQDNIQQVLSMVNHESTLTWELLDVRKGSGTASALIGVSCDAFDAQISLELVRQDGEWLINSFTPVSFDLHGKTES